MNNKYDAIIVGGGMGGLSTAAFLSQVGKKVLVLEKHDKPGGYATSFIRKGCLFDNGIEGLSELRDDNFIGQCFKIWEEPVTVKKRNEIIRVFVGHEDYIIDPIHLENDLIRYFPEEKKAIQKFINLNNTIIDELYHKGDPPRDPNEMSIIEKIQFAVKSMKNQPTFMKYGMKDAIPLIKKLFKNNKLRNIVSSKGFFNNMVYMAYVYRWEVVRKDMVLYPVGGIQKIPDTTVKVIKKYGGDVILNTQVVKILIKDDKVIGVECNNGDRYIAEIVISNASPHHTLYSLIDDVPKLDKIRKTISKRKIFAPIFFIYVGVNKEYDFKSNYLVFSNENSMDILEKSHTPENCPISIIVQEIPKNQKDQSIVIMAALPYDYHNTWETYSSGKRGKQYYDLKKNVADILLRRTASYLGDDFLDAVKFSIPATPLTSEHYTNSTEGSFMGWSLDAKNYGKFLPQTMPINNLYIVGQWVFPGGGVAGVMVSGLYLADKILRKEGISLLDKFKSYLEKK